MVNSIIHILDSFWKFVELHWDIIFRKLIYQKGKSKMFKQRILVSLSSRKWENIGSYILSLRSRMRRFFTWSYSFPSYILVIFLLLSKQTILTIYCISVCVNITLFALLSLLIRPKKKKLSKSSNFSESWNLRKEHWFVKTHVQRKKCPKLSKEYTRWSIHKIMRFLKSLK